jgi:hypothetical protein
MTSPHEDRAARFEADRAALQKAIEQRSRAFLEPPYGAALCLGCQSPLDMKRLGDDTFVVFCPAGCSEVILVMLDNGRLAMRRLKANTPLGRFHVIVN